MIVVENLTRRFGDFTAVDSLSFTVSPGEVLGFLGPNGAGKSTTMKMITGFLRPTAGTVMIGGVDVWRAPLPAKAMVGYLPEGAPGYGEMTVQGFLAFIAAVRGFAGAEKARRVSMACEMVDLRDVRHQTLDTLSKGYRRRVGLAQALLHDPRILILDEPTDGLDPNQKHQVRELIRRLSTEKLVVVSTHILEEVGAVCSRAMVIAKGRLLADATPTELEMQSRYCGAVTLGTTVAADSSNIATVLSGVTGVLSVEQDAQGQYTVFPQNRAAATGLVERVQAVMQSHHLPVLSLKIEQGRLDDVFRRLTGGV